ncbi:MAG TPA: hypothetical protein VFQ53_20750 [Kofleriaceae bacterium]|nr:hypothetical protein [Kofleriaceae bacterium]
MAASRSRRLAIPAALAFTIVGWGMQAMWGCDDDSSRRSDDAPTGDASEPPIADAGDAMSDAIVDASDGALDGPGDAAPPDTPG